MPRPHASICNADELGNHNLGTVGRILADIYGLCL